MADTPIQVISMPIPEIDETGFLPEGVHQATLEEVREPFGRFQRTDRRPVLFSQLSLFLAEVRASGLVEAVIVDGSFVTAKDEPSDIDLILVLRPDHRALHLFKMPSLVKSVRTWEALRRTVSAIFVAPVVRRKPIAAFRRAAMISGPDPLRIRLASSPSVTSRT